jgi:hypothetical protein
MLVSVQAHAVASLDSALRGDERSNAFRASSKRLAPARPRPRVVHNCACDTRSPKPLADRQAVGEQSPARVHSRRAYCDQALVFSVIATPWSLPSRRSTVSARR